MTKKYLIAPLSISIFIFLFFLARPSLYAVVPRVNALESVSSTGAYANGDSYNSSLSSDGRFIVFESDASNLVASDTNGGRDIFLRDRITGNVRMISTSSADAQGTSPSTTPELSYNGNYVVFMSAANNLVTGDTNAKNDIFMKNLITGATTLVSTNTTGVQQNGNAQLPTISGDGRYVAFASNATNLVATTTSNAYDQIYLKDTVTGRTDLLSKNSSGVSANANSGGVKSSCDGTIIDFYSSATNLVSTDTNGVQDIFTSHLTPSGYELSSFTLGFNAGTGGGSVSCNGNKIVYNTAATNVIAGLSPSNSQVYEYDRLSGASTLVSQNSSGTAANDWSGNSNVSDDGRYIVFISLSTNLDSSHTYASGQGENYVFVRDMKKSGAEAISLDVANRAQGHNYYPAISSDGSVVSYYTQVEELASGTDNTRALVAGDRNGHEDVISSKTGF
jgi:hypothetical protein